MKRSKSLSYLGRKHIPLPTGRFVVGCADIMTDYSKYGVFLRLYYPAEEESATERYMQWPHWIPSKEYITGYAMSAGVSPTLMKVVNFIFIGDIYIPAVWHAVLSEENFRYPVIVFSHGLTAWRTTYSTICLEMASQGFIVASLEHRDYSACATFYKKQARMSFCGEYPASFLNYDEQPVSESDEEWKDAVDGQWSPRTRSQGVGPPSKTTEWIYYKKIESQVEKTVRTQQLQTRVQECVAVLDILERLDSGKPVVNALEGKFRLRMFRGRLDLSKVAVAGHSFGGATAISALALEKRFRVGIALDPWMFPLQNDQTSLSMGHQPLMVINMEKFQDTKNLRIMRALQRKETVRKFFTIRKAHHKDQTDANFIRRKWLQFFSNIGRGVNSFTVVDLTSRLMLEFLGKYLDIPVSDEYPDICSKKERYLKEEPFM